MLMLSKTYQVATYESAELSDSSIGQNTWVSSYPETDYRTGAETTYNLHFVGPESKRKYWVKALNLKFNRR